MELTEPFIGTVTNQRAYCITKPVIVIRLITLGPSLVTFCVQRESNPHSASQAPLLIASPAQLWPPPAVYAMTLTSSVFIICQTLIERASSETARTLHRVPDWPTLTPQSINQLENYWKKLHYP